MDSKQRKALPSSSFAGPNRSFPMNDLKHIRLAKSMERFADPATKKKIDAKAAAAGVGQKPLLNQLKKGYK